VSLLAEVLSDPAAPAAAAADLFGAKAAVFSGMCGFQGHRRQT